MYEKNANYHPLEVVFASDPSLPGTEDPAPDGPEFCRSGSSADFNSQFSADQAYREHSYQLYFSAQFGNRPGLQ
jgi:hypothetical protein